MISKSSDLKPVLKLRLDGHDRHAVLFRLYQSMAIPGAIVQFPDNPLGAAVLIHSARVLLNCDCREGQMLRSAVRRACGESAKSNIEVTVRGLHVAPAICGSPGRLAEKRPTEGRYTTLKSKSGGSRFWIRSTRRIEVGAMMILHLAGWPTHVTGVGSTTAR